MRDTVLCHRLLGTGVAVERKVAKVAQRVARSARERSKHNVKGGRGRCGNLQSASTRDSAAGSKNKTKKQISEELSKAINNMKKLWKSRCDRRSK